MAFDDWVGRSEDATDLATEAPLAGLRALLDAQAPDRPADVLPPLAHWLFFRPDAPQSALASDGHPERAADGLIPPTPLPRRMWAGGRLRFDAPVPVGATMTRRSTVQAVAEKLGRTGPMLFVTLVHEIVVDGAVAIREEQDLVYREASAAALPPPSPVAAPEGTTSTVTPGPVHLFRWSALTFNAHRIHYDADYARDVEGYPGLVVQGPYLATLLLSHSMRCRPERFVAAFDFRARSPLFAGEDVGLTLTGDGTLLATGPRGAAVEANVRWRD